MIYSRVLVLNRSYFPVNLTTVKQAFCMLYRGVAMAVDSQYKTFDYQSWLQIAVEHRDDALIVDVTSLAGAAVVAVAAA